MTGFGGAEGPVAGGVLRVEIRSVNHRFFNLSVRVPNELAAFEAELRDQLRREFERGHLAVTGRWVLAPSSLNGAGPIDPTRARDAVNQLRELQTAAGLSGEIPLELVLRHVGASHQPEGQAQVAWPEVEPIVARAASQCGEARAKEGSVLTQELSDRLSALRKEADAVKELAPARAERERERLRQSVSHLLDGRTVDEARLLQEIVFLSERHDVTEELVRFEAHLVACQEALRESGPVGKRLGFLAQELGREVNTIGSKANDAAMQHVVVAMKGELERFREQLENLE